MNILFYTSSKVSSTEGGTERATINVATGLKSKYGCNCYSAYRIETCMPKEDCFVSEIKWDIHDGKDILEKYIDINFIDRIIIQGLFDSVKTIKEVSQRRNCKIIFAHHFEPGWEEHFLRFDQLLLLFRKADSLRDFLKYSAKILLYPILLHDHKCRLHKYYKTTYELSDYVVLLSSYYVEQYVRYAELENADKFRSIPNALSYNEYLDISRIANKRKYVLIVSRLDDPPKRISLALRIWMEVKKKTESTGWKLLIIGHGPDEMLYRKMIKKCKIDDVCLLGRQKPKQYYIDSSIFMMTSRSEGWGLTLTEAQQFGVVPIAFNTYASLKNIISDGVNGIIIPDNDIVNYSNNLLELMNNHSKRNELAMNAVSSSSRFSQNNIAQRWYELLNLN